MTTSQPGPPRSHGSEGAATLAEARAIVEATVWATVTTVGPDGRPRSRLMHPVWSWDGPAPTALVVARPTPLKLRHLAANPHVACFYWAEHHDTAALDATARWLAEEERRAAWEAVAATPPPVGFDPALIWPDGPSSPDFAVLSLTAHRVVARRAGAAAAIWRRPN